MNNLFNEQAGFNEDISSWDVSSVMDMWGMFNGVSSFNDNISSWEMSSATNMQGVFSGAFSFSGDVSSWDVSSVTIMLYIFYGASSFSGDIRLWDVSSVTTWNTTNNPMFDGASSFDNDNSPWNTDVIATSNKVRVQLRGSNIMHLAEVKVYDVSGRNVARLSGAVASQSSEYGCYPSSNTLNDNMGDFSHTQKEQGKNQPQLYK